MEHLSLEIFDIATKENPNPTGSKFAVLPDGASITLTDTNEIFASGDVWSHSFTLNVYANAHIFGTSGDMHGSRLHEQINKRKARLWVMGIPLYMGFLKLDDEVEVDGNGNVDVAFESGQKTFDDMIEGAKANQVPLMNDIEIGMALWRKRYTKFNVKLEASVELDTPTWSDRKVFSGPVNNGNWITFEYDGEEDGNSVQEYPRMVFPNGTFYSRHDGDVIWSENCINTDFPYSEDENGTPLHPYCNVALCYQKYGYEHKDKYGNVTTDYSSEPEAQRGYEYMPANRVNSAPNFYVIYWIRCLMKHLCIHVDENQMLDVEDLKRLFFVNTKVAYEEPKKLRTVEYNARYGQYKPYSNHPSVIPEYLNPEKNVNREESGFAGLNAKFTDTHSDVTNPVSVTISDVQEWSDEDTSYYLEKNNWFHRAFATSECFPNVEISDIIKAIEDGFGVRFLFSDSYKRVRIVLLRNIFRSRDVQHIDCDITEFSKTENSIRGFKMTYGESEDTHFYYKGFADLLPHKKELWVDNSDKHDYSQWNLDADYSKIINKISAFDKTCYVTPNNGNAYGIKVDKDAKRYDELHPSLFEYAGYMDAEDGDCTGEEETIETVTVGFKPAIMNDLNMDAERGKNGTPPVKKQRFALFVDESMQPRRCNYLNPEDHDYFNDPQNIYLVDALYFDGSPASSMKADGIVKPGEFAVRSDMYAHLDNATAKIRYSQWSVSVTTDIMFDIDGHINEGCRLYLQDNFEPNEDGVNPIEKHDWGLTLGIMRGSGSDAHVNYTFDWDDGENNDTWYIEPGSSVTAHPDTCDNYGNEWDYNASIHVETQEDAAHEINTRFTDTASAIMAPRFYVTAGDLKNKGWNMSGDMTREVLYYYYLMTIHADSGEYINVYCSPVKWYRTRAHYASDGIMTRDELERYVMDLWSQYGTEFTEHDTEQLIYAVDPDDWNLIPYLQSIYFGYETDKDFDNGLGITDGRFSLKLRAEKPNPKYDPKNPPQMVSTKTQAAETMTEMFTTSDTNLLTRPTVTASDLEAAEWAVWLEYGETLPAKATLYSQILSVDIGGKWRKVLWTPIKEDGTVLDIGQLQIYANTFNGLQMSQVRSHDTQHLILDIDTTQERKDILENLQDIYYAEPGEFPESVCVGEPQYLEITDENLRQRGLCDQFYKEYSHWVRNARIWTGTVHMELAQLLAIDKTKRVTVGDITGFIKKMQFTVSKEKGLGGVTMEIMYI